MYRTSISLLTARSVIEKRLMIGVCRHPYLFLHTIHHELHYLSILTICSAQIRSTTEVLLTKILIVYTLPSVVRLNY